MTTRKPQGYVGKHHETIGSDIQAVLRTILFPDQILGKELAAKLASVKPNDWYPIEWLLTAMEVLAKNVGEHGLQQMGRQLFRLSHADRFKESARSAGDLCFSLDGMYHHANRGEEIGGWEVLKFGPGTAELAKTTPHHCAMEEGILAEAFATLGIPVFMEQTQCFRKGARRCVIKVSSVVKDERWMGRHAAKG